MKLATFAQSLLAPATSVAALLFALDLSLVAHTLGLRTWPITVGLVLASAALLGIFLQGVTAVLGLCEHAGARLGLKGVGHRMGLASLLALWPALWTAALITEGDGISTSPYGRPLFALSAVGILALAVLCAWSWPRWRVAGRCWRIVAGSGFLFIGALLLAATTFQPATYVRPHRALLLLAVVVLGAAFALLSDRHRAWPVEPAANQGSRAVVLALLLAGGLALAEVNQPLRMLVRHQLYLRSLITQKLQGLLGAPLPAADLLARAQDQSQLLAPPPQPWKERGRYRGKHVVLLTIDALRADRLGLEVGGRKLTPAMDGLSTSALVFDHGTANYTHTLRSIRALQAGSWQVPVGQLGLKDDQAVGRPRRLVLADAFAAAGYHTIGVFPDNWRFDPQSLPGFAAHSLKSKRCQAIVQHFGSLLRARPAERPVFAWLHFYEPHGPFKNGTPDPRLGEGKLGAYNDAVRKADQCVAELRRLLEKEGLWEDTVFVLSADHGEGLGEHDRLLRHSTCYWHDAHIPLLVRLPDRAQGHRIAYRFQLSDLFPTLANLFDLSLDGALIAGRDLSGLLAPDPMFNRADLGWAFTEGHYRQYPCAGLLQDRWHVIYNQYAATYELYDVVADPREENNQVAAHPEILARLQALVLGFWQRPRPPPRNDCCDRVQVAKPLGF